METEAETESVYAELDPPVATDAIEEWFELSSSGDKVEPHQSIALIKARAQLERLVQQRDFSRVELAAMREAHQGACETIAQMHKAAVGETRGPIRGVVEDVQDLRSRCLAAEQAAGLAGLPWRVYAQPEGGARWLVNAFATRALAERFAERHPTEYGPLTIEAADEATDG